MNGGEAYAYGFCKVQLDYCPWEGSGIFERLFTCIICHQGNCHAFIEGSDAEIHGFGIDQADKSSTNCTTKED